MARVKHNIITQGMSGNLERKILFKHYGNKTIITTFPDRSKVKLTEGQKKENTRFREAMAYARSQMADPVSKAEYKAKAKGLQKPHNVAIADFYHPPEIKHIDVTGFHGHKNDSITIQAVDDFKVLKVMLSISDKEGALLETGEASQMNKWNWKYKVVNDCDAESIQITATAWDKPGNMAKATIIIDKLNGKK